MNLSRNLNEAKAIITTCENKALHSRNRNNSGPKARGCITV